MLRHHESISVWLRFVVHAASVHVTLRPLALAAGTMLMIVALIATSPAAIADDGITIGKTPIHRTVSASPESPRRSDSGSGGTTLVFLGLLLAAAIVIRRIVQQRLQTKHNGTSGNAVTLLSRQQIDNELTVHLLQIGPRVLLVGSSPQGLTTLADITDSVEVARLTGATPPTDAAEGSSLFEGRSPIRGAADPSPDRRRTSQAVTTTNAEVAR